MFKRLLLFQAMLFCSFHLNAQKLDNLKLAIEAGAPTFTDSDNLGLLFHAEPKLKVSERVFMGMRVAVAINSQTFKNHDPNRFAIDEEFDHGFLSIVPTLDHYWHKKNLHPYVGLGIGPYSLANAIDVFRTNTANPSLRVFEVKLDYRIGALLRAGLERGRARLGLEYNFVPKADIKSPDGETIGTVNSSYFGWSIGYVLGKKWQ